MKIRPVIILFSICLVGLFCTCKLRSNPNERDENISSPDTSGETVVFDSEIKKYESEDRVIWQKPDLVIDQLGNVEGKVVADLGAGTGYFSRRIAYKGATVIAIDIDPEAILWMEEQRSRFPPELRERLIIRQAEADNPHLNPNEVDIVLLVNTYTYITNRVEYFRELQKAIRPRGSIVIIDFKKKQTPFGPPLEERVAEADVEKELREAGYDIVRMDVESLEYQYIIKATRS